MTSQLTTCSGLIELLRQTALRLFEVDCPDIFLKPLIDISLGDLSSDICLQLGATLKRDVGKIEALMFESLSSSGEFAWNSLHGYLNIRLPDQALAGIDCKQSALWKPADPYHIIVPGPGGELQGLPHLRLASLAFLHALLLSGLGHPTSLECGELSLEMAGHLDWGSKYRELCTHSFGRDGRTTELTGILTALAKAPARRAFVWMPVERLNHGDLAEFYRTHESATNMVRFRCPPRGWINQVDIDQPALASLASWPDEHIKNLLIYLCSEISGSDLDLYVPLLNESANPRWYFSTLCTRSILLKKSYSVLDEQPTAAQPIHFSSHDRSLLLRLTFLDTFMRLAAYEGDCVEFSLALGDCLRRFSHFLNDPSFRIALESNAAPLEGRIVYAASTRLSESTLLHRLLGTAI